MQLKKYCVVEFTAEKSVEAIPSCWIDESQLNAYWPKFRTPAQFRKFVAETALPDKRTWELCSIRIIKTTGLSLGCVYSDYSTTYVSLTYVCIICQ